MQEKHIDGVPIGYEFTQPEFRALAQNLSLFAHAGIAGEIRANSQNTRFGQLVTLHSKARYDRGVRHGYSQTDIMGRLRHERDLVRVLLDSEAPVEKEDDRSVVLGMFTTQTAFEQLARPIEERSSNLVKPELITSMRDQFLLEHPQVSANPEA